MSGYDAHTHLDFPEVAPGAAERAREAGITGWCIAGADPTHWDRVVETGTQTGGHVALGIHPWFADTYANRTEALLATLSDRPRPDALGEVGLDRLRPGFGTTQDTVARAQLALARDLDLPVVLHCVRAHGALLDLLEHDGLPAAGGLIHAFRGAPELARRYVRLGLHVSIRMPTSDKARAAFAAIDPTRRLLESDAPDGGPEPAAVAQLAVELAPHCGTSPAALLAQTGANARRLFPRDVREETA